MAKKYHSDSIRNDLNTELAQFKKELSQFSRQFNSIEEWEAFSEGGSDGLTKYRVNEKSNGKALELGLELSELAKLYKVDVSAIITQAITVYESPFFEFVQPTKDGTLEVNEGKAAKHILKASQYTFNELQKELIEGAEAVCDALNLLQSKLAKKGATSIPLSNIVSLSKWNEAKPNVSYIKSVAR